MTLPTAAQARSVDTVSTVEANLLAQFAAATVAGWPTGAPQRDLVHGEALAIQWEEVQRACVAYASSPARVLQLAPFLISQGYSASDAATIASAWTDIVLEVYQTPRIPASYAQWQVPLVGTAPYTIDNTSTMTVQASDGTIFTTTQATSLQANVGNSYKVAPTFQARNAGTGGNVIPGTLVRILSGPSGVNLDMTGTQYLVTPARNAESDLDALTRAQGRLGTLSAILTAAGWLYVLTTSAIGGVSTLTRVFVDDTRGDGSVAIALANAAGPATAAELSAAQAQAAKYKIAGAGPVTLFSAASVSVAITATLKTNGTNPLAAAQGASALAQLGPAISGNWLYLDAVIAALMGVPGVVNISSLSLTADVARPSGSVIVITPTITAT